MHRVTIRLTRCPFPRTARDENLERKVEASVVEAAAISEGVGTKLPGVEHRGMDIGRGSEMSRCADLRPK
jgi:hypothetical protein